MKHLLQLAALVAMTATTGTAATHTVRHRSLEKPAETSLTTVRHPHIEIKNPAKMPSSVKAPQGERHDYVVSSYWASGTQDITQFYFDIGIMASLYDGEDDTSVYLQGIMPAYQEKAIAGTRESDRMTFASGQLVSEWATGNMYIGGATYNSRSEQYTIIPTFSFDISETDGLIKLNDTDSGQKVYLLAYLENGMILEADYNMMLTPFRETVAVPPADAEITPYVCTHFDDVSKFPYKAVVNTAVKGDEIWLEGFSGATTGYVKGEIMKDGSIYIPTGQVTVAQPGTYINHMFTAKKNESDSQIYLTEAMILTPNGDSYSSERTDYIRYGYDESTIEYQYKQFTLDPYDMSPRKPATPVIDAVKVLGPEDDYIPGHFPGEVYMTFYIPTECEDGILLDPKSMSYRIFINGEPYTFTPDIYTGIPEAMTEIPYTFSDLKDITHMDTHTLYLRMDGIKKVGVESIYDNGTEIRVSDREETEVKLPGSVTDISDDIPVSTEWLDMTGCAISRPENGIFIHKEIFADGTAKHTLIKK